MAETNDLPPTEKSFWEKPGTLRGLGVTLAISALAFVVAGFLLGGPKKPHFEDKTGLAGMVGGLADGFPAFYGLIGLVSVIVVILLIGPVRALLTKEEGYYDDNDPDAPRPDRGGEA